MNGNLESCFEVKDLEFQRLRELVVCGDGELEPFYLKAVYEFKNKSCRGALTIPYINISPVLPTFSLPSIVGDINEHGPTAKRFLKVDMDDNFLSIYSVNHTFGDCFKVKIIEEYPVKMTLKEIEDKLGHKVEIISE